MSSFWGTTVRRKNPKYHLHASWPSNLLLTGHAVLCSWVWSRINSKQKERLKNVIYEVNMISARFLFRAQSIFFTFSRLFTHQSYRSTSSSHNPKNLVQTDQKSLAWVQLHEESSASYGIDLWGGYSEMIPPKAPLPCEKTINLENAVGYIRYENFVILYRQSILEAPVELAKVQLNGIRVAPNGVTRMKATMKIGKDLVGVFKTHDIYTKSAASVVFDAGAAFRAPRRHGIIVRDDWLFLPSDPSWQYTVTIVQLFITMWL